jgi:hypothetical protein
MFIADQITLKAGFPAAQARLRELVADELLRRASADAYDETIASCWHG